MIHHEGPLAQLQTEINFAREKEDMVLFLSSTRYYDSLEEDPCYTTQITEAVDSYILDYKMFLGDKVLLNFEFDGEGLLSGTISYKKERIDGTRLDRERAIANALREDFIREGFKSMFER